MKKSKNSHPACNTKYDDYISTLWYLKAPSPHEWKHKHNFK